MTTNQIHVNGLRFWAHHGCMEEEAIIGQEYRVDVTLDEPIRTSILCGVCGHVEVLDGSRPSAFTCPSCSTSLWDEEE